MEIFQIKTKPHGKERLNEFIQGGFIAIGWPGIGDLNSVPKEEVRQRLEKKYSYDNSRSLGNDLGNVWAFSHTMQDGDIVLFNGHQSTVYIVKVGPYKYAEEYDNDEGMAHQRPFKLLQVAEKANLNPKIQELLRNRSAVTKFKYPIEEAEIKALNTEYSLEKFSSGKVKESAIEEALEILYTALKSENKDHQLKAATELLRYEK
ncbi:hypothetical protein GLW03_08490 [Halobacillus halophilus]|uniref:hypothetical protein n=1 Tax=Halobacillus halophilus TaxID=1570 RepID=UPI00136DA125|nr:hypothetical protein [Halobacillus halophilus]MYL29851.1 hypothetical protein [Halobacillus halophilus]